MAITETAFSMLQMGTEAAQATTERAGGPLSKKAGTVKPESAFASLKLVSDATQRITETGKGSNLNTSA